MIKTFREVSGVFLVENDRTGAWTEGGNGEQGVAEVHRQDLRKLKPSLSFDPYHRTETHLPCPCCSVSSRRIPQQATGMWQSTRQPVFWRPHLSPPQPHRNNFYTSLNDTSNKLKNYISNESIFFCVCVPLAFLVPCPLLFESTFSAVTILYFVLKHTYLSCHCIHQ